MPSASFVMAVAAYAFVTSITPGPNNAMLLASGMNHGMRATLPHLLGITIGFSVMLFLVGLGFGTVFLQFPFLYRLIQVVGACYMLYLAWQIAHAAALGEGSGKASKPLTFLQAAAFQWVNPKAWVLALGVTSTYLPQTGYFTFLAVAVVVYAVINFPSIAVWAGLGEMMRHRLADVRVRRIFNWTMAALLVASLYPLFHATLPA